ncbi:hypothetical protein [uncultured Veillonella sp.]|uniref:hypothetical protein n=1 Tax=uncultured Veillonella sp. TaxID=159268 RepID=UPI0025E0A746|nr:hypothetical protein [uncultured Veillonella sp.]
MISEATIHNLYLGRRVKLIDTDGKIWKGRLKGIEGSNDTENGKYCVDMKVDGMEHKRISYCFEEDEIKSIEVID